MRFMLIDCEGNAIEAELLKTDYRLLPVKPADDQVYIFKQFRVNEARNEYNATSHKFIIRFHKFTKVMKVKNIEQTIPHYYFNFKDLGDIGVELRKPKTVIDVIGRLSAIGDVQPVPGVEGVYTKDILLANEIDETVRVTLWSEFMDLIQDEVMKETSKTRPVILAFSSLELKHYQACSFTARLILWSRLTGDIDQIQSLPPLEVQPARASKLTTPIVMTLQEMVELEPYSSSDQQYMCEATVSEILSTDSWCYTACSGCKTTLTSNDCERCHITDATPIQWYRIALRVTAGLASAVFVLMGKQAEQVIGLKARTLLDEAHRTSRMLPAQLAGIVGRRFKFVVEINLSQFYRNRLSFDINQLDEIESARATRHPTHDVRGKRLLSDDSPRTPSNPNGGHTGLSPIAAKISLGSQLNSDDSTTDDASSKK
ncbi:hypothetical protein LUZ61_001313 [Rhynchospora tenuis]|uniref:Replication factor A C-terminal domain-containing protein n=1 Tax=Rhynchospora tenuis TaxID=198213 RepID=A0AAD5ZGT6_9POAL|nr:hypothetical protein LUZ61_001313 [Rhynchospora tenuis]